MKGASVHYLLFCYVGVALAMSYGHRPSNESLEPIFTDLWTHELNIA